MTQERSAGPFEQLGEAVGGTLGKAAGRANDVAAGAVGSVVGSAMQVLGAWWATPDAQRASGSFGDAEDRACRRHFESSGRAAASSAGPAGGAGDYGRAREAYRFGHVARHNPEYSSRPFDQVEAQVERAWEQVGRESHGEWSGVRDQVSFGYTHREPGAPNPS